MMTSASEASVAAQTATTPPGRHTTSSLKDLPMTQQPDPFSELRGLMAAAKVLAGYPEDDESDADLGRKFIAARASFGALLDERDRLIEALTEMRTAGVYLCGCRARGAPKAFIPIAEQKFLDALDLARQALSQEIG